MQEMLIFYRFTVSFNNFLFNLYILKGVRVINAQKNSFKKYTSRSFANTCYNEFVQLA